MAELAKLRYTVKEAAAIMSCSPQHIRNLMDSNVLPWHTDAAARQAPPNPRERRYVRAEHLTDYLDWIDNQAA